MIKKSAFSIYQFLDLCGFLYLEIVDVISEYSGSTVSGSSQVRPDIKMNITGKVENAHFQFIR